MFKKILTSSLLTLVAFGGFFGVSLEQGENTTRIEVASTYAASGDTNNKAAATEDADMKKVLNSIVNVLNIILSILTIIVTPAIMLASWLMSPDWTAGDIFGIRPVLHDLWITISNITYFVYAILLIFIAIATIFNSEHYGYKSMLPKLALGIILVPLTWWGVQFTISVATYVTAAAISVPYESIQKYDKGGWWNEKSIPENIKYINKKFESNGDPIGEKTDCNAGTKCISPKDFISKAGGMFSPLLVYSFSVFKIQDIKTINTRTDVVTSVMNIIHQGIIGVIMFMVYGLLVMALIFMLLMRAMKLWFYAIFSPLFTIKYVLGDKGFGDADKDGSFKITEFIGLAFVPAVVSLALGFGLIIVSALQSPLNKENPNNYCVGTKCTINIMGTTANQIVSDVVDDGNGGKKSQTKVTIGGVSYTWEGSVTAKDGSVASVKSALGATGNLFGTIIIDIIALVFIWLAFMAGKGVSKAAGKAIEPFEAMGKKIGELGMSLPKYTPIPGLPGGSISGLKKTVDMGGSALEHINQKKLDNDPFYQKAKMLAGQTGDANKIATTQGVLKNAGTKDEIHKDARLWNAQDNATYIATVTKDKETLNHALLKFGDKEKLELKRILDNPSSSATEKLQAQAMMQGKLWTEVQDKNTETLKGMVNEMNKNSSVNSSAGSNTFNISKDQNGKYSLEGTDFKGWTSLSPTEIMKKLNDSIPQLTKINQDTLRNELKEMQVNDDEIKKLLGKIEEEAKKSK